MPTISPTTILIGLIKRVNKKDGISLELSKIVRLSYDILPKESKKILGVLSCFLPDDLPARLLFRNNNGFTINNYNISYDECKTHLARLGELSFCEYEPSTELGMYSMHRLIQECIKDFQENELIENYRISILLLARAFKKNTVDDLLISHIDAIIANFAIGAINPTSYMNDAERIEAVQLFINAGQYHTEVGDNKSASEQFKVAITTAEPHAQSSKNQEKLDDLTANAQKRLANVLFLGGKEYLPEATKLIFQAIDHYERRREIIDSISCKNDVLNKILQRQCLFDQCESVLEEIEQQVVDEIQLINNNLYKHIADHYVNKGKGTLVEKKSGIYHNLGSLYWTRGEQGDYERAAYYFDESIRFQDKLINALKDKFLDLNDLTIRSEDLKKIIDDKLFWQSVSKMLYGAVLGLLGQFDKQWQNHQEAFDNLEKRDKRRFSYNAYYQLAYSWDRKAVEKEWKWPDGINANSLIQKVKKYDETLAGNDEKYDLIKKIVNLREATENSDKEDLVLSYFNELKVQLEAMKYTEPVVRYYDVDTCSVSAILDYAIFLKDNGKINDSKEVAEYGLEVTRGIKYPRIKELETLAKGN